MELICSFEAFLFLGLSNEIGLVIEDLIILSFGPALLSFGFVFALFLNVLPVGLTIKLLSYLDLLVLYGFLNDLITVKHIFIIPFSVASKLPLRVLSHVTLELGLVGVFIVNNL